MTDMALVRPLSAVLWELRTAWASGRRVAVSLDDRCRPRRLEGKVGRVAPTGVTVVVEGRSVPLDAVLAVHFPSRLGDSSFDDDEGVRWAGRGRRAWEPQRERLW